ncbi:metal ABC transporter substrate-binding protein [Pseudactinotalea sp.]|uniref:metal ABC transporter substrate-binding protein n=1 Tax=Pseudactinotalea sp. TaxID=1926260 RepID=UPI003B3A6569
MTSRRVLAALLFPALALGAAGCSAGEDDGEVEIAVTAYPLQFIAERVAGETATVTNVAPAGTEPHDLELSPSGVSTILNADAVLMLSGFQAAVDDTIGEIDDDGPVVVDAADSADLLTSEDDHEHEEEHGDEDHEHDHGGVDPHFWLDPMRVAAVADALAAALAESDPDNAATYETNAAELRTDLDSLEGEISEGLAECVERTFVTSHEAFGYLADAFDLTQIGISGLDPEAEPSPARVAEVLQEASDAGVTTIFTQPGGLTAGADTVAAELGVTLATLDPIELTPEGSDYLGAMRSNLSALHEGLQCS